jgi:hypothetical protein
MKFRPEFCQPNSDWSELWWILQLSGTTQKLQAWRFLIGPTDFKVPSNRYSRLKDDSSSEIQGTSQTIITRVTLISNGKRANRLGRLSSYSIVLLSICTTSSLH